MGKSAATKAPKEKTREELRVETLSDTEIAEEYVAVWVAVKELEESQKVYKEELSRRYKERYGDKLAGAAIEAGGGVVLEREPGSSSSIDKMKLLDAGVEVKTILDCTNHTDYWKWQVRAPKVGKV